MRKVLWFALLGALTVAAGGCATAPPEQAASPQATPVAVPIAPASPAASPGETLAERGTVPPDLITSTDPDQRLREIRRNRPDPFSLVPVNPEVVEVVRTPTQPANAPSAPNARGSAPQGGGNARQPSVALGPGRLAPIPNLVPNSRPNTTTLPALPPPPPQPTLARAVQVLGVVQIGGTAHAIVMAPNEPSSRYVQAGQRLANGQVLVKRIDMRGVEPTVVLEENGIEVPVAVGEGGSAPSQPTASALPTSRPL